MYAFLFLYMYACVVYAHVCAVQVCHLCAYFLEARKGCQVTCFVFLSALFL